ncbi:MAG: hypothetical protein CBC42_00415 [Betaproteobacteria bacterium TMED82]|nr:MAG: hypothetical protein CBC42_00415 [Betaproteobacteria bacterium TMED82]
MNFFKSLLKSEPKMSGNLLAAVDLGSNSFHLIIAKAVDLEGQTKIKKIDNIKEQVRLADGLDGEKSLNLSSRMRALFCLRRFGERLRSFSPDTVRAVATNTFRIAKNSKVFLKECEEALGFPIEVISGVEEARLIYKGVAQSILSDKQKALVIDVGGGSSEFIIGEGPRPKELESVFIGCCRLNKEFFSGKNITKNNFEKAILLARKEIQVITAAFKKEGWDMCYGCSGTIRSIHEVCNANGMSKDGITFQSLVRLKNNLVSIGFRSPELLPGLKPERVALFPGGLAILIAIFKELKIKKMELCDVALRTGVLYEVWGRSWDDDARTTTIKCLMKQYEVDTLHSNRLAQLANLFSENMHFDGVEKNSEMNKLIEWSAMLLELGQSISHSSYHKHSAYIIANSEMPGFTRREQEVMASLVLGHVGKLGKVSSFMADKSKLAALVCLRCAAIFLRSRRDLKLPPMQLSVREGSIDLHMSSEWLMKYPLTAFTLEQEAKEWAKMKIEFCIKFNLTDEAAA